MGQGPAQPGERAGQQRPDRRSDHRAAAATRRPQGPPRPMGEPQAVCRRYDRGAPAGPTPGLGGQPPDHHRPVPHDSLGRRHPDDLRRYHADAHQRCRRRHRHPSVPPTGPHCLFQPGRAVASRPDLELGADDRSPGRAAVRPLRHQRAVEHVAQHFSAAAPELGFHAHPAHGHGEGRVARPALLRRPGLVRPAAPGAKRFHQPACVDDRDRVRPPPDPPHAGHDDRALVRRELDSCRGGADLPDPSLHRGHALRLEGLQHRALGFATAASHAVHGLARHDRFVRQGGQAFRSRPVLHRAVPTHRERLLRQPEVSTRPPVHDRFRAGQPQHDCHVDNVSVHRPAGDRRPDVAG